MKNSDNKFNQTEYASAYNKENYTQCKVSLRSHEAAILTEFSANLGLSKNALLQKCLLYCYENMIDVSKIKLSKPEK